MARLTVLVLALAVLLSGLITGGCAAWREPPGPGEILSRYEVPGPPPDPPTHVASDVMLRRSGALLLRKGRYKRAAQHVKPLLDKYPRHYLATAYMGLCRWFQGKPEDTAALWRGYDNPQLPGLGRALTREAEGLLLLAERLRARRAVFEAGQGRLAPVAEGLTAVFDPVPDPALADLAAAGPALAALTGRALKDADAELRDVPRDRIRAWLAETGASPMAVVQDPLRARGLARLMGAEYAVTGRLLPDPAVPGGMGLDLLVLPAEDPPERRSRLQGRMTRITERLEAIASERETLGRNMVIYDTGLEHFRDLERLDGLLRERDTAKERIRTLMEAGDLEAGRTARGDLADLQERIEALHEHTESFRMAAFAARLGMFTVDKPMLEDFRSEAGARLRDLTAEAARLEARRRDLAAQLDRELPVHGVPVRADLPPFMARTWPALAAGAAARALGLTPPATSLMLEDESGERMAALGRALTARDQGRWEDSERAFGQAGSLADPVRPSAQPPVDFDPDALAGLDETAMAEALEGRILDIMTREAGAFQSAGGSAAEFDRLAEGR